MLPQNTLSPVNAGQPAVTTDDTRTQPWKKILGDAKIQQGAGDKTDFFKASNGLYAASLSG